MKEYCRGTVAASENGHNRRDVLRGAASAGLLSLLASPTNGHANVFAPSAGALDKVVFDDRYSASRAFGRTMAAAGYDTAPVADDVTDLWYHDLHHRWRKAPAAIAGLTSLRAAFCLESLAGDVWMRPVYRGEHRLAPDGEWRHTLQGEASATLLDGRAEQWGARLARMVSAAANHQTLRAKPFIGATAPWSAAATEPLISWLIVPTHRS